MGFVVHSTSTGGYTWEIFEKLKKEWALYSLACSLVFDVFRASTSIDANFSSILHTHSYKTHTSIYLFYTFIQ